MNLLPVLFLLLASPVAAFAQSTAQSPTQPPAVPPVTLPTVVVTAQKEPADAQRLPVSVSAANRETIERAGVSAVSDAAIVSPNTVFAELSATQGQQRRTSAASGRARRTPA